MRRVPPLLAVLALAGHLSGARAEAPPSADFVPGPWSVQRHGPAYRYPQAGWIVLHIEGEPYERGCQHGRLLPTEIAAHLRCYAAFLCPKAPAEGWKLVRTLANALFLRRYDREYLEEMKGIADGASAAGARFDGRPIDLVDIVALNAWPEIDTLESALGATPTGLEGVKFPDGVQLMPGPKPERCSAFAATGPATADGKVVFGHITMFALYPSNFYNVWLDVKPAKGHRVLMQSYPGGMQSGMDYYLNDAGLLVCETTIRQTKFDVNGLALASRIRKALQYADSIDQAVALLKEGNNGLYTNEWLLADVKTNEIAMFELGTQKTKLYRSSQKEWFGGTEGFYWGCNNTKDLDVRLETVSSVEGRPANVVFRPSDRDKVWQRLYARHKGKIDVAFAKEAFTTPPLAAYHSVDAKFTTTDLAKELKTWALFGPPLGRTWEPTFEERQQFPEVRPLVSNPWTVLHAAAPAKVDPKGRVAVDLDGAGKKSAAEAGEENHDRRGATNPAWRGTLLPKTDADVWLAAAFADYERIYSREKALLRKAGDKGLAAADRERLALDLFAARSSYLAAARASEDVPLSKIKSDVTQDHWYRIAAGKGVLLLHDLRRYLGDAKFEALMDSFGRENAGKSVTATRFQEYLIRAGGKNAKVVDKFFEYWLGETGLPRLALGEGRVTKSADEYLVDVEVQREGGWLRAPFELVVETDKGEVREAFVLESFGTTFTVRTKDRPRRVVLDKYGQTAKANGGTFNVGSFFAELDQTLIVYGTADEAAAHREAAQELQRAIIQRGPNITVPVKSDKEVTEEDLKSHHLLLVGRPDSNAVVARVRDALPVRFGSRSFEVLGDTCAHPDSAVVAAADNPFRPRYSVVVIAGLGAYSTRQTAAQWLQRAGPPAEVLVLANGQAVRPLVVPARELVRELQEK